jgi:hypothetical protein
MQEAPGSILSTRKKNKVQSNCLWKGKAKENRKSSFFPAVLTKLFDGAGCGSGDRASAQEVWPKEKSKAN